MTVVDIAVVGVPAELMFDRREIRGSAAAITDLRRLGIEAVVIIGDNARTVAAITGQVGVRRVLAEVLP
ncbi:hypothetical protein [Saccharopolyspora phatthalungensis]|uniref:Cation transport ATPase n=1 Tax=Saccharopolyspora phatthalungensis TaxID=664693 RepID=A0A840QBQ8_9PSEU|nr:hypothetical protein [Saccharopolyspora phatthalungensis]MBB5155989.1 cation transport ATPase [Saccharopolyspora phatthalungensis]